jgi:colanic acid/amylovoran biosynthesis glycosyltransferase
MRLAYLVSQYPAVNHTFILREIRTLRSLGFDVEVISIRSPDRPFDQLSAEEQEEAGRTWAVLAAGPAAFLRAHVATLAARPLGYVRGLGLALGLARLDLRAAFFNLAYFAEAVVAGRRIHSQGLPHLHTHFNSTVALFVTRIYSSLTFSATIHGPDEFNDVRGFFLAEKVAAARFLCAISRYARSQLMRVSRPEHWHKIELAPLGVDTSVFAPRPHRARPERFEILSVGRLAAVKGQALLIEAVAALVAQGRTGLRLRIAGEGPEHAALAGLIAGQKLERYVSLEGACSQDRVRELYRETDLFALASFAEGVPVVLMEAMSMEIPCVAPWVNGVPELIRHNVDGWLVPPADAAVLASVIADLMDHPELRENLGRSARMRIEEAYDLAENTRRLAAIYRRRLEPAASTAS